MELRPISAEDFDDIYRAMREGFVREERRDYDAARALLCIPAYTVYHTVEAGARVGFITVWQMETFAFVEHFVTYPAYRGRGYGGRVLALLQERLGNIVLEVEHPTTPLAARRIAFYERAGFCQNDYPYIQPSYHGKGGEIPLILMSYPARLDAPEAVARLLYREIYHVPFGE